MFLPRTLKVSDRSAEQALRQYREEFVGNAQAVVVGMTSNGFTLADPKCLRTATTRHAGCGRLRHQRARAVISDFVRAGVMTSRQSVGTRMQEANMVGGGESFHPLLSL
jgi:hypothetical protein